MKLFPYLKILSASAALILSACLFESERPGRPGSQAKGDVELRIKTGAVGALAKRSKSTAIELADLYITLSAENETPRHDTLSLSGSGANTVGRTYTGLAANKTWQLQAYSLDNRGRTIHSGSASFMVQAGRTAAVSLDLAPYYSMLTARFYPIDDSVTRCQMLVDGSTVGDTSFSAQTLVGDTVRLAYDYLNVGSRRITLNVFGTWAGTAMLLYSGDTTVNVVSGGNNRYNLRLVWRGPGVAHGSAAMSVVLGAVGAVEVNGQLLTSKNQEPVFSSSESDLSNTAAPGVAYLDTIHAFDPDGDSVAFSFIDAPAGMTLSDSLVSWIPDSGSANQVIRILAQDGKGGRDTLTWNITLYSSVLGGLISHDITLSRANSPYWVTGNVLLGEGATMIIEPGVRVVFSEGRGIQINGTLIARGTATDSIRFTSTQPSVSRWARILFTDSSRDAGFDGAGTYTGGSILEYCHIEYGGRGVSGAVQMENASPYVHRSRVAYSESRGIAALGLPSIVECTIRKNSEGGVSYSTTSSSRRGILDGNRIDSNATDTRHWFSGAGVYASGTVLIHENIISNNGTLNYGYGGGVYTDWGCCGSMTAIISGNRIEGNRALGRAALYSSNDSISGNVIRWNEARSDGLISLGSSIFVDNTVVDNTTSYNARSVLIAGQNSRIAGNNFSNPELGYDLENVGSSTSPNLAATENWWGTADELEVQGRIYDWFDDASRGIVSYSPFLIAPAEGAPAP